VIQLNLPPRKDECNGVRIVSKARPPSSTRRRHRVRRAVGLALGLGTAGLLAVLAAQPAAAEVTLTPSEGVQGDAAEIAFGVSEDRAPASTTKIQIVMPDANPVAEVYPLSTDDWAPLMTYRTLSTALPGVHGAQSDSVVSAITWTRAVAPGAVTAADVNELRISLGPLPQTSDLRFLVVQTYSDGVVKRWTDTVMTLKAPAGQEGQQQVQPTHAGAGHAAAPPAGAEGGNLGIVVGVIVALVIGVAIGGAVVASSRMRPRDDGGEDGGSPGADAAATGAEPLASAEPAEGQQPEHRPTP